MIDQKIRFGERYLNGIGYSYLRNDQLEWAVDIFKKNLELFPNCPNCHDSLGEAYRDSGDKALARQHFERAIQLAKERGGHSDSVFFKNTWTIWAISITCDPAGNC